MNLDMYTLEPNETRQVYNGPLTVEFIVAISSGYQYFSDKKKFGVEKFLLQKIFKKIGQK